MPYALKNPQDGYEPAYVAVPEGYAPNAGEVVVSKVPPGDVWDAANGRLRPKTDAERLAEAKAAKKDELNAAAQDAIPAEVYRLVLLRSNGATLTTAQKSTIQAGLDVFARLAALNAQVDAAADAAAVGAVWW